MAVLTRQHQLQVGDNTARLGYKRTFRQEMGPAECGYRAERRDGEDGEVGTLGRSALDRSRLL